jgi:hypothetical protein
MRSHPASASLIAALAFAGGCGAPAVPKPIGNQAVTLDGATRQVTVATRLGMQLVLALPPIAEPGHVWQIVYDDTRYLKPLGEVTAPTEESGRATIAFHVMTTGRTVLRFLALPIDPVREARPVDRYDVVVNIK